MKAVGKLIRSYVRIALPSMGKTSYASFAETSKSSPLNDVSITVCSTTLLLPAADEKKPDAAVYLADAIVRFRDSEIVLASFREAATP